MTPKTSRLIHWEGDLPEIGHYLQTRKGSTYLIIGVTPNRRVDAKSIAKLDMLKFDPCDIDSIPSESIIHYFQWGPRK